MFCFDIFKFSWKQDVELESPRQKCVILITNLSWNVLLNLFEDEFIFLLWIFFFYCLRYPETKLRAALQLSIKDEFWEKTFKTDRYYNTFHNKIFLTNSEEKFRLSFHRSVLFVSGTQSQEEELLLVFLSRSKT